MINVPNLGVSGELYNRVIDPLGRLLQQKDAAIEEEVRRLMQKLTTQAEEYRADVDARYQSAS